MWCVWGPWRTARVPRAPTQKTPRLTAWFILGSWSWKLHGRTYWLDIQVTTVTTTEQNVHAEWTYIWVNDHISLTSIYFGHDSRARSLWSHPNDSGSHGSNSIKSNCKGISMLTHHHMTKGWISLDSLWAPPLKNENTSLWIPCMMDSWSGKWIRHRLSKPRNSHTMPKCTVGFKPLDVSKEF